MVNLKIRNAEESKLQEIREQRVAAYSEYINVIPAGHWEALKKGLSSTVDLQLGVELIVCELDETIVGSVALFPAKTNAYDGYIDELENPEIRMLAVAPAARGKGVASTLISECIKRTKEKGFKAIGLHTGDFMKNAISLYERFGFERSPQFDFEPANDGIVVRAYQLKWDKGTGSLSR